ncbi:hypothetical protein ACVJBD_000353 [Rhizobium mongolense]
MCGIVEIRIRRLKTTAQYQSPGDPRNNAEGNYGLQHRRQILRSPQHAVPFVEPRIFIPVEIINQRILFPGTDAVRRPCLLERRFGPGQYRIDGGELGVKQAGAVIAVLPLPFSSLIDTRRGTFPLGDAVATKRWSRPRLAAEGTETLGRQCPAGRLGRNASAGFQDVAGDGEFVGRSADVAGGVVEDEVFEMDEFAVDPQRGAGRGSVGISAIIPAKRFFV